MNPHGSYGAPTAVPPAVVPSRTPAGGARIGLLALFMIGSLFAVTVALVARSGTAALLSGGLLVVTTLVGFVVRRRVHHGDLAAAAAATGLRHVTDQRTLLAALPAERVDEWYRAYPLNVGVIGGLQGWYRGSPVTYVLVRLGLTDEGRTHAVVRLDLPVTLPRSTALPRQVHEPTSWPSGMVPVPLPPDAFRDRYMVGSVDPPAAARLFSGPVAAELVRHADARRKLSVAFHGPAVLVGALGIAADAIGLLDTAVALRDGIMSGAR